MKAWHVTAGEQTGWCEVLYQAKASELILYGRALGLSHGEAEDVLQETFLALMRRPQAPALPEHYCVRAFRNRALNYRRSLWRRLAREWEAAHWFEAAPSDGPAEREAMRCLADLPCEQREVIVLKIGPLHLRCDRRVARNLPEYRRRPLPLRPPETAAAPETN